MTCNGPRSVIQVAEAARCPPGKIYRVSLEKCAPRAENLQFLKKSSREIKAPVARARVATRETPPIPARRNVSADAGLKDVKNYVEAEAPIDPPFTVKAAAPQSTTAWPYGALR